MFTLSTIPKKKSIVFLKIFLVYFCIVNNAIYNCKIKLNEIKYYIRQLYYTNEITNAILQRKPLQRTDLRWGVQGGTTCPKSVLHKDLRKVLQL